MLKRVLLLAVLFASLRSLPAAADEAEFGTLEKSYTAEVRPLVVKYCQQCHSSRQAEADLNLASFPTLADVRKHPQAWMKVREMLETGQMPPEEAKQPGEAERTKLKQWVREYLTVEARALAGDPGRVVLRRLSNAEYTYTVRDLTRLADLSPAREFPVDGAAGEGFTNTGNALVMSPALITKYLDAAKEIAGHAVLLPDGIRFSPGTTRRDWTEETLAEIRGLYAKYSDSQGGSQVNLQGIVFETNGGGRLPLEKYFAATLAEREALTSGTKTVDAVARERGLSPKYLGGLWKLLSTENSGEPSLLIDGIRSRWRAARPEDAPALAADIIRWQQ